MKERILSAIIASLIVFISLPGIILAPTVLASANEEQISQHQLPAPRGYLAALPPAPKVAAPQKLVGADGRESLGVKITAPRVFVIDQASNATLYSAKEHDQVPLASITKLMTARVARSHGLLWDKQVTMSAVVPDGGTAYFANDDVVTVRDLWKAMLVGSSNTAAATLAKTTGLSADQFVAEMNAMAAGLGMADTHFVEPTGLDQNNISSAADIATLARVEFQDQEVVATTAISGFDLVKVKGTTKRVLSTDKLLGSFIAKAPYKLLGAKTGYITESGYNIVISVTKDGATPITVVVLGAASNDLRFQEAKSVAYWTFQNYRWPAARLTAATK